MIQIEKNWPENYCLTHKSGLDKLFLVGSSGAEACDAAMKLSYQYFYNLGKKK